MFASGSLGCLLLISMMDFVTGRSIIFSFLSVYLIFPLVTIALMFAIKTTQGDIFIGSMILAAQVVNAGFCRRGLPQVQTAMSPLALIITIINNMTSAVLTPSCAQSKRCRLSEPVSFNAGEMIIKLLLAACASHKYLPRYCAG